MVLRRRLWNWGRWLPCRSLASLALAALATCRVEPCPAVVDGFQKPPGFVQSEAAETKLSWRVESAPPSAEGISAVVPRSNSSSCRKMFEGENGFTRGLGGEPVLGGSSVQSCKRPLQRCWMRISENLSPGILLWSSALGSFTACAVRVTLSASSYPNSCFAAGVACLPFFLTVLILGKNFCFCFLMLFGVFHLLSESDTVVPLELNC